MSTRPFISWAYIYSVAFGRLLAFFYAQNHFYNLTRFYIARQHAHVCRTRYCFTNSVCRSVRLSVCLSIVGTVCKQMDLSSYFLDINLCVRTVWHRMTKFGTVTPVGRSIFLGVSHAHIVHTKGIRPKGWTAPASPEFLGPPHACTNSTRNNNEILHGDQTTDVRQILHSRPRMLTRDLFAVATFPLCTEVDFEQSRSHLSLAKRVWHL